MPITKPTREFLEDQPYLYRAFAFSGAEIEVYDSSLDGWPPNAKLLVNGQERPPDGPHGPYPLTWWFNRLDQQDEKTGEKFTVLVFRMAEGKLGPWGPYKADPGTYKIDLVVGGELRRTTYLTVLPWEDPTVRLVEEEEVNGDLVRVTFKVAWPNDMKKVMVLLGKEGGWDGNGPNKGYMAGSLEMSHDDKTGITTIKGVTYRWMTGQQIILTVGAESLTGAKDTGGRYRGTIGETKVYIGFERGPYAEMAPHTRHGFRVGMGSVMSGKKVYTVGGSRLGRIWPFGKWHSSHSLADVPAWNEQVAPRLEQTFSETREWRDIHFQGQRPPADHMLDNDSTVYETDLSGSSPSKIVDQSDKTPRQWPAISFENGKITWGWGEFMLPNVGYRFFGHNPGGSRASFTGQLVELEVKNLGDVPFAMSMSQFDKSYSEVSTFDSSWSDPVNDRGGYTFGHVAESRMSMSAARTGQPSLTYWNKTTIAKVTAYNPDAAPPEFLQFIQNGGF